MYGGKTNDHEVRNEVQVRMLKHSTVNGEINLIELKKAKTKLRVSNSVYFKSRGTIK